MLILHKEGRKDGSDEYLYLEDMAVSGLPEVLEYRHGSSRWLLKLTSYRHFPVILVYPFSSNHRLSEIDSRPRLIKLAQDYDTSWYDPVLLEFLSLTGWDARKLQPTYRDETRAAAFTSARNKAIRYIDPPFDTDVDRFHANKFRNQLIDFFLAALDALSTDKPRLKGWDLRDARRFARFVLDDVPLVPPRDAWQLEADHCRDFLDRSGTMPEFADAANLLLNIDLSQTLISDDFSMSPFVFLPSKYGHGFQPSLRGWPGNARWKENYSHLRGVAVRPKYDPDNLAVALAEHHFHECGVVFLDDSEVENYGRQKAGRRFRRRLKLPNDLSISSKIASALRALAPGR